MSSTQRKIQEEPAKKTGGRSINSAQAQERLNQLVQEVRLLEAYYQEITTRQQAMSGGILESRAALEALEALSGPSEKSLLIPIGSGILLPVSADHLEKLVVSVGAGVAVEKDPLTTKSFLNERLQELEKAITSLDEQRKEIGSRLEAGRATLQRLAQ